MSAAAIILVCSTGAIQTARVGVYSSGAGGFPCFFDLCCVFKCRRTHFPGWMRARRKFRRLKPICWGNCGFYNTARLALSRFCLRFQWAIEVAGGRAAINEEGGTCDKRAAIAHQQLGDVCDFIRRAGAVCGTFGEHILIEISARAVEFIQRQRGNHDAGRDGVQPRAALAP